MTLTDRILVPLDGSPLSEQVLPFVVRRAQDAQIVALHMIDEPATAGADAQLRQRLEVARTRLALASASVELEVQVGPPADGIVARAGALGASVIRFVRDLARADGPR